MSKLDDKDLDNVAGGTTGLNQGPSGSNVVRPNAPPEDDGPCSGDGGGGGTPLDPDTPNQGVND